MTVSYTHLDVYKRQVGDRPAAAVGVGVIHRAVDDVGHRLEAPMRVPRGALGPVSYTHLDVYKRQRLDLLADLGPHVGGPHDRAEAVGRADRLSLIHI